MPTIQDRPVLEQLEEAIKWWNADEAEEPDVRRLFASCKARIEALEGALRDAAAKFREYEKLHLAKLKRDGTDALDFVKECERKARDNAGMAEMLEAALAGEPPVGRSPESVYAAQRPDEELRAAATELLRLYDWRNEIGRVERDFNHDRKQVTTWLNQYGREKKAAWVTLRAILARGDVPPPALLAIPAEWLEPGAVVPVDAPTTGHLIRMVRELLKPDVVPKMGEPWRSDSIRLQHELDELWLTAERLLRAARTSLKVRDHEQAARVLRVSCEGFEEGAERLGFDLKPTLAYVAGFEDVPSGVKLP